LSNKLSPSLNIIKKLKHNNNQKTLSGVQDRIKQTLKQTKADDINININCLNEDLRYIHPWNTLRCLIFFCFSSLFTSNLSLSTTGLSVQFDRNAKKLFHAVVLQ